MTDRIKCPNGTCPAEKLKYEKMKRQHAKCPDVVYLDDVCKYFFKQIGPDYIQNVSTPLCPACDNLFNKAARGETCYQVSEKDKCQCEDADIHLEKYLANLGDDNVKNQIKYNLAQLLNCNIKQKAAKVSAQFGSFDWWKDNVWGQNKIQNFIYIVTYFVVTIAIMYFIFKLFSGNFMELLKINTTIGYLYITAFLIIGIIVVFYYSLADIDYWKKPDIDDKTCKDLNIVASHGEYQKYNEKKGIQEEPYQPFAKYPLGFIVGLLVLANVLLSLYAYFLKDKGQPNNLITGIAILTWLGLAIIFNIFYSFLIPQIILAIIILQKIFFMDFSIWYKLIIVAITFFAPLFASINNEVPSWSYFIFALFSVYLVIYIWTPNIKSNWSIVLMPILKYIINLVSDIKISDLDNINA